ncbi:Hsp70 family protein [Metabacillus sp. KIGAM252]|uniref:Chaperone protein DnaK n=1 Tax=Metabacillus flavus TaxID=2823519 RepID=A0ABS5LIX5_9BACI|nr:Hsp70 family protein [Metabacillus flavus]MBS2970691.1 Hsp70 family protein [Metabacillus flavus]
MSKINKVYGIDLGTTYSCIAHMDEHSKADIITNSNGIKTTPSVVFFEDEGETTNIVVGEAAKESGKLYPNDVVSFIKRQMGTDYEFWNKDQQYRAEEISALILKKLAKDAEGKTGEPVKDVVITVPAYFGINEREATKRAGELADLNVVDIINEPTAAAIAYGISRETSKRVLVYDLGGGTFDVTLIDISPSAIEVIVTGGDHNLGGKNWDDAIINYLVEQYEEQTGNTDDVLEDAETAKELEVGAESAKKTLSDRKKAPISYIHGSDKIRVELTREKFEELTDTLLNRTIELTKLMLEEAKLKGEGKDQFDEIILVGGSTRMPQVETRIIQEFNVQPVKFDPDEAVAKGAAIYGMEKSIREWVQAKKEEMISQTGAGGEQELSLEKQEEIQEEVKRQASQTFKIGGKAIDVITETKIINVTSKSFGVVTTEIENGERVQKVTNLIKKNESLPIVNTQQFGTLEDHQDSVFIEIMENEFNDDHLEVIDATAIGEAELTIPPGLPANSPLEITFVLGDNGRLDVKAVELTDNRVIEVSIETTSVISTEQMAEAKEKSKSLVVL